MYLYLQHKTQAYGTAATRKTGKSGRTGASPRRKRQKHTAYGCIG